MKPVVEDEAGARHQCRQQPDHLCVDVEQGKRVEAAIALAQPMVRDHSACRVEELLLGQPDHLGRTRGARGGQRHSPAPVRLAGARCRVILVGPVPTTLSSSIHATPAPTGAGPIGHHHAGADTLEGRGEPGRGHRRVERSDPEPGGERPEERGRELQRVADGEPDRDRPIGLCVPTEVPPPLGAPVQLPERQRPGVAPRAPGTAWTQGSPARLLMTSRSERSPVRSDPVPGPACGPGTRGLFETTVGISTSSEGRHSA